MGTCAEQLWQQRGALEHLQVERRESMGQHRPHQGALGRPHSRAQGRGRGAGGLGWGWWWNE